MLGRLRRAPDFAREDGMATQDERVRSEAFQGATDAAGARPIGDGRVEPRPGPGRFSTERRRLLTAPVPCLLRHDLRKGFQEGPVCGHGFRRRKYIIVAAPGDDHQGLGTGCQG